MIVYLFARLLRFQGSFLGIISFDHLDHLSDTFIGSLKILGLPETTC